MFWARLLAEDGGRFVRADVEAGEIVVRDGRLQAVAAQ
jgi:hypothetical protein